MRIKYHQILKAMYDARTTYEEELGSRHPCVADRLVDAVSIAKGMQALDVCTGTGLVARRVANRTGTSGRVIGIDFSEVMLEQARRKSEAHGIRNIEFVVGDANSMNFEPCSFDLIFCCEALVLLDDPMEQLQAWNHYLRPGGVVAFTCTHENSYFARHLQQVLQGVICVPVPAHMHQPLGTQDKILRALESANFQLPTIESEFSGRWKPLDQVRCDRSFVQMIFKGDSVVSDLSDDQMGRMCRDFRLKIAETAASNQVWEDTSLFYVHARKVM